MKAKAFSMLFALALAVSAPMVAQTAGESVSQPTQPAAESTSATSPAPAPVAAEPAASNAVTPPSTDTATEPVATTDVKTPATNELPKTASPLAALALLAVGTAGGALAVRAVRRRV